MKNQSSLLNYYTKPMPKTLVSSFVNKYL